MKKTAILLTIISALLPSATNAAGCDPDEAIEHCYRRLTGSFDDKEKAITQEQTLAGTEKELAEKNTGLGISGSNLGGNLADFLSNFVLAGATGDSGTGDKTPVAIEANRFLGIPTDDGYKLQIVFNNPNLFEPLKQAYLDASLGSRAAELADQLNRTDDYSIVAAWAPVSESIGRSFRFHRRTAASIFDAFQHEVSKDLTRASDAADNRYSNEIVKGLDDLRLDQSTATFEDIKDPATRKKMREALNSIVSAHVTEDQALSQLMHEKGFFRLSDLLNNQPQFSLSLTQRERKELAGPKEFSVSLSYEKGWANLNALRQACKDPANLSCYMSYVAEHESEIKAGDRVALQIEYTSIRPYQFSSVSDGIDLNLDGERKLTGTLSYGRYIQFDGQGQGIGRIEASAKYEDPGSDPNRNTRAIASVTFSRQFSKDMTLVVGASYANRPEFLTGADRELSGHLGLNYKFLNGK